MVEKYHKIHRLGKHAIPDKELVYAEEKLDGANFRVWFENGTIRFGTRCTEFPVHVTGYGNFQAPVEYVKALRWDSVDTNNKIFFFEAMIPHTIQYDWTQTPKAVLFDIFDIQDNRYVCLAHKQHIAQDLDCQTPQVVYLGENKEFTEADIPKSAYGDLTAEGIVVKPQVTLFDIHGEIVRGKLVREEFKEQNMKTFRRNKQEYHKEQEFVEKFVNEARLNKNYLKMKDLSIPKTAFFAALSNMVLYDCVSEELKKVMSLKKVSFVDMGRLTNDKVRAFLKDKGDI